MYLAPKKPSVFYRARILLVALLFFLFLWFGGGRLVVAVVARVGALMPQYLSSSDSAEVALVKAQLANAERERDILNGFGAPTKRTILVPVSVSPGYFFGDTMILDSGESAGVASGHVVVTDGGIALGTIDHVGSGWSSVSLISVPGKKTTIRLSASESTSTSTPAKNILVDAEGVGGGELRVDLPVSLSITAGAVAWWGEHPEYPVGVVDHIDQSPARQVQSVFIRLPVSLSALAHVVVLP